MVVLALEEFNDFIMARTNRNNSMKCTRESVIKRFVSHCTQTVLEEVNDDDDDEGIFFNNLKLRDLQAIESKPPVIIVS